MSVNKWRGTKKNGMVKNINNKTRNEYFLCSK